MPDMPYQRWDVFTSRPFSGNQLAVLLDATAIPDDDLQRIANEFSLPETAFVLPSSAAGCAYRLRIFTPARELPMAGHPTIGATFALAAAGLIDNRAPSVTLELGVGPTNVDLDWQETRLGRAWMSQPPPVFGPTMDDAQALGNVLGVPSSDLAFGDTPAQFLSSGVQLLFVPLPSRALVDAVALDRAALQRLCRQHGVEECPVYVFCTDEAGTGQAYSRMFAPVFGIPEDPATGGACGPLGAYLAKYRPAVLIDGGLVNRQGVKMGRPSTLYISVGEHGSGAAPRVGGEAVFVGEGCLRL